MGTLRAEFDSFTPDAEDPRLVAAAAEIASLQARVRDLEGLRGDLSDLSDRALNRLEERLKGVRAKRALAAKVEECRVCEPEYLGLQRKLLACTTRAQLDEWTGRYRPRLESPPLPYEHLELLRKTYRDVELRVGGGQP